MSPLNAAFDAGVVAYKTGKPQRDNPFSNHPAAVKWERRKHVRWLNGWRWARTADMRFRMGNPREGSAPPYPADAVVVFGRVVVSDYENVVAPLKAEA